MRKLLLFLSVSLLASFVQASSALEPVPDALFVRVIDVGAGLCCVVVTPDGHYMIYDAGQYKDRGALTAARIAELIPLGSVVDLLVLSHSDADHLGAVDEICDSYTVNQIVHSGYTRPTRTYKEAAAAIRSEKRYEGALVYDLAQTPLEFGQEEAVGECTVTWVFGLSRPPKVWKKQFKLSASEEKNAGSVVVKLSYGGKNILLCGDSVGRHTDDEPDVCIAAERSMVDNADVVPLQSDIIIAPHHGADNGSSTEFIAEVQPVYVIFSAGHEYEHPRQSTVGRYLAFGVPESNFFRTDAGDNEGDDEWQDNRGNGEEDQPGDDDVDILIHDTGDLIVAYRSE